MPQSPLEYTPTVWVDQVEPAQIVEDYEIVSQDANALSLVFIDRTVPETFGTPVNKTRMDNIEQGIVSASTAVNTESSRNDTQDSRLDTIESTLPDKADSTALSTHIGDKTNPHGVTAAQVGLGNVTNTSDADKAISTATQTALDAKVPFTDYIRAPGFALATLFGNTYAVTTTPAPAAYANGMAIRIAPDVSSPAGARLNWNGLGAANILNLDGTPLGAGDLLSTGAYTLVYRNGNFIVLGKGGDAEIVLDGVATMPPLAQWTIKAPPPVAATGHVAPTVGNVIYMLGNGNRNDAYDTLTNTWSTRTNVPTNRGNLTAQAVGNLIYAIGGNPSSSTYSNANEAYDTATDTWATKAPVNTTRSEISSGVVNGRIYVFGKDVNNTSVTLNEVYDPIANTWAAKANVPTSRYWRPAVAAVNGIIYVMGGGGTANEAYDPGSDTWNTKAPVPLSYPYRNAAAAYDGIISIVGWGYDPLNIHIWYIPASDTWGGAGQTIPTGRGNASATVVNGVMYVIGGNAGDASMNPKQVNEAVQVPLRSTVALVTEGSKVKLDAPSSIGGQLIPANTETTVTGSGWLRTMADTVSGTIKMKKGTVA